MIRALAKANVDFTQTNRDGLTALDVAEGKQPPAAAGRAAGRGNAPPPAAGRGRGGGRGGANRQEVAKLLRELMGLPPAPPAAESPASPAPAEAPAAEPADEPAEPVAADAGDAQ
jgi:hypothetical protein